MKKKRLSKPVDIKALRKLLRSLSHPSKTQKAQLYNTTLVTAAVVLVIGVFAVSPTLQNYFGSQPSEAGSVLLPGGVNPTGLSGTGGPVNPSVAPWGTGPSDVDPDSGIEYLIAENGREPKIHNNRIVYRVCAIGDIHGFYSGDIYMNDLNTHQTVAISTAPGVQINPAIFDHYIVWADYPQGLFGNHGSDIHLYDLTTHTEINISNSPTTDSLLPTVYGDKVAWIDRSFPGPTDYKLMLYNIDTGVIEQIDTSGAEYPWAPDIFEDTLVWENLGTYGEPVRVWIRNLDTGATQSLPTFGYHQASPRIYGSWVVWVDYRHNQGEQYNTEIYAYNLETPQILPKRLTYYTETGGRALSPAIYRDIVVWSGNEKDHYYATFDVWAKRLSSLISKDKIRLTIAENIQISSDIFANKVVWEDYRNGIGSQPRIYMFEMWQ